jgi:hypothetical protein
LSATVFKFPNKRADKSDLTEAVPGNTPRLRPERPVRIRAHLKSSIGQLTRIGFRTLSGIGWMQVADFQRWDTHEILFLSEKPISIMSHGFSAGNFLLCS